MVSRAASTRWTRDGSIRLPTSQGTVSVRIACSQHQRIGSEQENASFSRQTEIEHTTKRSCCNGTRSCLVVFGDLGVCWCTHHGRVDEHQVVGAPAVGDKPHPHTALHRPVPRRTTPHHTTNTGAWASSHTVSKYPRSAHGRHSVGVLSEHVSARRHGAATARRQRPRSQHTHTRSACGRHSEDALSRHTTAAWLPQGKRAASTRSASRQDVASTRSTRSACRQHAVSA